MKIDGRILVEEVTLFFMHHRAFSLHIITRDFVWSDELDPVIARVSFMIDRVKQIDFSRSNSPEYIIRKVSGSDILPVIDKNFFHIR